MFLKSLSMKGFKSFADKVTLTLEPGITAIVGPNGSGKSNISDAVLWTLGERNARNLRGHAMEDVIFAGSSARKPTSVAEVELVLDNSDGTLPVDFKEVSIARRMYRSGESEYLINGVVSRRMDVLEILHDSGLGTGTHSIISQGSLDSVLQSRPEDRRALIEEAAGTLKHKDRMQKSARKLERMSDHVERVSDIANEVGRQLGPLERKAKRAKTYETLAKEMADAKLELAVDDLRNLQARHDELKASEGLLEADASAKHIALEEMSKELGELQEKARLESEDAGEVSKQQRFAEKAQERLASTITLIRERKRIALGRVEELTVEAESAISAIQKSTCELEQARRSADTASKAEEEATSRVDILNTKLKDMDNQLLDIQKEKEDQQVKVADLEQEITLVREMQAQTQESLNSGLAHMKVIDGHASELELQLSKAQADAKAAEAEAEALESAFDEMEIQEKAARELLATCTNAREAARLALDNANASVQSISAQLDALAEIERTDIEHSGDAQTAVEAFSEQEGWNTKKLSHLIKVSPDIENLVEMLLGQDVMSLVIDDSTLSEKAYQVLLNDDIQGVVTFIAESDLSPAYKVKAEALSKPSEDGFRIMDSIECDAAYKDAIEALLGDVVIVEDASQALRLHASDMAGRRFVTKSGFIAWPNGKITMGHIDSTGENGVLARSRRASELKELLQESLKSVEQAKDEAENADASLRRAQSESLSASEKLAALRGSMRSARLQADQAKEKLESATRELEELEGARKEAQLAVAEARPSMSALEKKLEELRVSLAKAKTDLDAFTDKESPLKAESEAISGELAEARLEAARMSERSQYAKSVIDRHLDILDESRAKKVELEELLQVKRVSVERLTPLIDSYESISLSCSSVLTRLQQKADDVRAANSGVHGRIAELREKERLSHLEYDEIAAKLSEMRIERTRVEMQVEAAVESIVGDLGATLEVALDRPVLENRTELEETVFRLTRRIANLGTINPDAAEEYDELKKRYDYLQSQLKDLEGAASALKKIDRIIEGRMKEDFIKTFEKVNENFEETFSTLFPGGSAHLSLDNPDDIENTGVEVNAQPAGKRITKMSLMSGGEKSLTALALLFALYRTRSTPFYILDEVEAALDDTNLRRLVSFIDAMRHETQLLMITHQRRTMESADVLFGVSMQADGVTKVISQKLGEALRSA